MYMSTTEHFWGITWAGKTEMNQFKQQCGTLLTIAPYPFLYNFFFVFSVQMDEDAVGLDDPEGWICEKYKAAEDF